MQHALSLTLDSQGIRSSDLVDFTSRLDLSCSPPRYNVYIEFIQANRHNVVHPDPLAFVRGLDLSLIDWPEFASRFDSFLQDLNPVYGKKRESERIASLQIKVMKHGSFNELKLAICGLGISPGETPFGKVCSTQNIQSITVNTNTLL